MATHNETGKKAEEISREFLVNKGYKILESNWRHYHKEIDILAEHENHLVVVEVKSVPERYYFSPSELLSHKKMRNLVDAAEAYILKYNVMQEVRFDLIVVIFSGKGEKIEHIESAFIPGVNW